MWRSQGAKVNYSSMRFLSKAGLDGRESMANMTGRLSPVLVARSTMWIAMALGLAACGEPGAQSQAPDSITARADCADVENVIDRTLCFADRAEAAGDLAPCDGADAEGVRFQCYAIYAERAETVEPCHRIPTDSEDGSDLRDACVSDVAKVTERAELCEEIVSHGLRDSCWLGVFRKTEDPALCDRIEDAGLRSACTGEPVYVE